VLRLAALYIVGAWVVLQVADLAFESWDIASSALRYVWLGAILGFPIALIFGWRYDITTKGLVRTPPRDADTQIDLSLRRSDYLILALLIVVAIGVIYPLTVQIGDSRSPQQVITQHEFEPNSIAVLPFLNLSSDPEQEYFADGLSEELLNLLARIPELKVASRSSAFSYKGKDFKIEDVGRELNVAHVLEGSVRKAGNQLRITAQLIKIEDGFHLWSNTWDRSLEDIFAIQDEISQAVVDELRIKLMGEAPRAKVVDPEAYALYLKAQHFLAKWGKENFEKSRVALKQALAIEPRYAEAWSQLSFIYLTQVKYGYLDRDEGVALASKANTKSLEIDPNNGLAWARQSFMREIEFDWAGAEAAANKSLELAPENHTVLTRAGNFAMTLGRNEEALVLYERILDENPISLFAHFNHANVLDRMGRLEEAAAGYKRHLELNPEDWGTHGRLTIIYMRQGNPERAMEEVALEPDPEMQAYARILILPALDRGDEALQRLDAYIADYAERLPHRIGAIYGWYGNNDEAFRWLNLAVDQRNVQAGNLMGYPLLAKLHDDPRWPELLARMGLPY
jgi:TolB-like protein/Tfp pilus assembly protein PilF